MTINFFGLSCFAFTSKLLSGHEYTLVTDPFDPQTAGPKLPLIKADIVVVSQVGSNLHNQAKLIKASKNSDQIKIIDSPGEYEIEDIFVQGSSQPGSPDLAFYLEIEKIKIGFLGSPQVNSHLAPGQMELLENCDVLILPIGGGAVLDAKAAAAITTQLEPRLVIPSFYKAPGVKLKDLSDVPEQFFKELGVPVKDPVDKLKLTVRELPVEDLQVVWMSF